MAREYHGPKRHSKGPYGTARWQRLRAAQLSAHPLCAMCLPHATPASVADHIEPHKGDLDKFWNGRLQSLCATHHNSDKQRMERGGKAKATTGEDGWPT